MIGLSHHLVLDNLLSTIFAPHLTPTRKSSTAFTYKLRKSLKATLYIKPYGICYTVEMVQHGTNQGIETIQRDSLAYLPFLKVPMMALSPVKCNTGIKAKGSWQRQ